MPGTETRAPVACCDLDGVVWRGDTPISGGDEAIAMLRAAGVRVVFVTNNSASTPQDYASRLGAMGIPTPPDDVLTSALAAARWCAERLPRGVRILACAGDGVRAALASEG